MSRRINYFTGVVGCPDADVQAFLTATGITDATIVNALCTLVSNAKTNGWWNICNAIYPFVGGTATTHKFNLKNPADTNAAFRLAFFGGWTHSANGGLPNGTNAYADTFINTSLISQTSFHFSVYSRTASVGVQVEFGNFQVIGNSIIHLRPAVNSLLGGVTPVLDFTTTTDARGFWLATKRANNDREAYFNGISQDTDLTNNATAFGNLNLFLAARNRSGFGAELFSSKEIAFATSGTGVSDSLSAQMYSDIQQFQTTLNRQV